jgi:hypothetical protein
MRVRLPTTTVGSCIENSKLLLTRTCLVIVLTLEAGVQWFEAYQAARQRNRVIVGGVSASGSVGAAGGWLQGGGHSPLASKYGLGNAKPLI